MNKKIKTLDALSLLSTTLWVGGVIFFILSFIFWQKRGTENLETINKIILAIFIGGIVFLAFALICTLYVSIVCLVTNWKLDKIEEQKKLLCLLNFIPVLIGIPGNFMTRKLMKNKTDILAAAPNDKKEKKEVKVDQPIQTQTTQQTTQPFPSTQLNQTVSKFPVNEPFAYDGKWMYFDGTYYYEAINNEWVYTTNIPQ